MAAVRPSLLGVAHEYADPLRASESASDLVQEAELRAWQKLEQFCGGETDEDTIAQILARESGGGPVSARGWLRTARHSKNVSFLELSDGSGFAGLQVVASPELAEYEEVVRHLATGCAIEVEGELVESQGKGQRWELQASRVELVGGVDDDYPLQKKRHSLEFLPQGLEVIIRYDG